MTANIRERLQGLAKRAVADGMKYTDATFLIAPREEQEINEMAKDPTISESMLERIRANGARTVIPLMYGFPIRWDSLVTRIAGLDRKQVDL